MKKIGILTSSRADYGIYYPLLCALREHNRFDPEIIAFGTHLSPYHGFTLNQIEQDGFAVPYLISSLLLSDEENSVATSYALTAMKFADFWTEHSDDFDLVFCLGDRFEMAAAVAAGIPFGTRFAHIHGGETTRGAIDNIYRHSITLASRLHFTATEVYSSRVKEMIGSENGVYTVGSLSLDRLKTWEPEPMDLFRNQWGIDLSLPTVLMTVHPETVAPSRNRTQVEVVSGFLEKLLETWQVVITMPNVDTSNSLYRQMYEEMQKKYPETLKLVENFGSEGYFTCMKHARMVVGNSSSGIIEAASLGKYVLNFGNRQEGRQKGDNVVDVPYELPTMLNAFEEIVKKGEFQGENPYDSGGAAEMILNALKNYFNLE